MNMCPCTLLTCRWPSTRHPFSTPFFHFSMKLYPLHYASHTLLTPTCGAVCLIWSTFQCLRWYARSSVWQSLQHSPSSPAPKQSPQGVSIGSAALGSSCFVASRTSSFVGTVMVI